MIIKLFWLRIKQIKKKKVCLRSNKSERDKYILLFSIDKHSMLIKYNSNE